MEDTNFPLLGVPQGQRRAKNGGFRLTGYRIFCSAIVLTWWSVKAIQVYHGHPTSPSLVDWFVLSAMVLGIVYLGRWEKANPPIWPKFYQTDYSREAIYLPLRGIGLALAAFCAVTLFLCFPLFTFVLPLAVLTAKGMRRTALFVSCGAFMAIAFLIVRILTMFQSSRRRNKAVLLLKNGEQATERVRSWPGFLDGTAVAIGTSSALYFYCTTLFHASMLLIQDIAR